MQPRPTRQHLPVTRASIFQIARHALERLALPPQPYASRAGVAHGWLDCDPEALVPLPAVYRLYEEAGREVEGFGAIAAEIPFEATGRFGCIMRGGLTVLDALERCVAFSADLSAGQHTRLIRDPKTDGVWFARWPTKLINDVFPQAELLVLRFMVQVGQLAVGPDWQPAALRFCSGEEASRAAELVPAFRGVRAETGMSWGGLLFPRETLGLPLPEMECGPLDDLESWTEEGPAGSVAVALRQLLLSCLRADQDLSLSAVAESLEVHPRKMQRRLLAEGASYRDVLDQARYVRARELIVANPGGSLTAIAYDLGYGDLSCFSRAFRRWAGEPPSALRRRLQLAG